MIKFIQCVRKRPDISLQEFRQHWQEYGRLLQGATVVGAARCTLSTTLVIKENLQIVLSRGTSAPFDGVAEIWFEDAPQAMEILQRPDFQDSLRAFQSYQESFIDLEASAFFLAAEEVLA